jgi:pimeloyl-ACP methyl ester carboxylesterase
MPYCNELFYREYENGATETGNPPLVLLHGSGGSHMAWPVELRRMHGRRVIALDLPGHGQSGKNACQSLEPLVAKLGNFLRDCRIRKAALAGHSLGAILALAYTAVLPSQVQGLALLSCGSRFTIPNTLFDTLLQAKQNGQFSEQFNQLVFDPAFPQAERRAIVEPLSKVRPSTLLMDLGICADFRLPVNLAAVKCPTLIINGAGDRITPPACARELAYALPNASLTTLPGCGHMLIYEKTTLISTMMRDFLVNIDAI